MRTARALIAASTAALCWAAASAAPTTGPTPAIEGASPIILVGGPATLQAVGDGVEARIDPNTPDSPFAGVASLFVGGRHLATGTLISPRHILTAAHCFDLNNDGVNEHGADVAVFFNVGDQPIVIPAGGVERVDFHPEFTGFGAPGVHDDLAIITLTDPVDANLPIYAIRPAPLAEGEIVEMVGYGASDGERGAGFFTTKRLGANVVDALISADAGSAQAEIWHFNFDGPDTAATSDWLGAGVEATLGPGDSGGPGFVRTTDGELELVSVNNYVTGEPVPGFGGGGGLVLASYTSWIDDVLYGAPTADLDGDGRVTSADLSELLSRWGTSDRSADLTRDGVVNTADLFELLARFER